MKPMRVKILQSVKRIFILSLIVVAIMLLLEKWVHVQNLPVSYLLGD